MTDLKYRDITPFSQAEIEREFLSGEEERIAEALYSATCYYDDWRWAQDLCLAYITSPYVSVRWAAATCLGDIAFLRRKLDKKTAVAALKTAMNDPAIADPAGYSLDMVEEFIPD